MNTINENKRILKDLKMTQFSVDKSAIPTFWIKKDSSLIYVNDASLDLLELSKKELMLRKFSDFITELPALNWNKYWTDIKKGKHLNFESRLKSKSGRFIDIEVTMNFVNYKQKEYCFAFVHNITERKRAERELLESESRIKALMSKMNVGIMLVDPQTYEIKETNPVALNMLGAEIEDVFGKISNDLIIKTKISDLFAEGNGQSNTSEALLVRKDGKKIPIIMTKVELELLEGRIVLVSFIDISIQKETELELEKAKKEAEAANLAKSQFLAKMSHEIRTPMNAILGFTDILMGSSLTNDQLKSLEIIKKSSNNLLDIINDILDISKIEAGELRRENIDFDFEKTLIEAFNIIQPKTKSQNVELICRIDENLSKYYQGDPLRLKQILINLLGNSAKFTESGFISLEAKLLRKEYYNSIVEFTIEDSGKGISEDYLAKLFDKFSQEDDSITRQYGGTGLGLSITKNLVDLLDGTIEVKSIVGKGTKFTIKLIMTHSRATYIDGNSIINKLNGRKVVAVDDNESSLNILKSYCRDARMDCSTFISGKELLSHIDQLQFSPDIFIFDTLMPDMNGFELLKQVKAKKFFENTPFVAITSDIYAGSTAQIQSTGFSYFLVKPVFKSTFYEWIATSLGLNEPNDFNKRSLKIENEVTLNNKKILIAEDNEINSYLMEKIIDEFGLQHETAHNGIEAIKKIENSKFDLILMDMEMPLMDGLSATRKIRAMNIKIPIIALTAHAMKEHQDKAIDAGMDDFISKPVQFDILKEKISKLINLDMKSEKRQDQVNNIIDIDKMLKFSGQNKKIIIDFLDMFIKKYPDRIRKLTNAIDNKNAEEIIKASHALNGALGYLAVPELTDLACEIENFGKENKLQEAQSKYTDFKMKLDLLVDTIKIELNKLRK